MVEFYAWTTGARNLITLLLSLCVLLQALSGALSTHRHPRSRTRRCENLLEACMLLHILVLSLLFGQIVNGYDISLIAPGAYGALRWAALLACSLLSLIVMVCIKSPWPLLIIAASALTSPAVEAAFTRLFPWLYVVALLFFFMRAIHICLLRYRELRTSISAFSIKSAVDSLHAGVLFHQMDGFVVLSNVQMQRLMVQITGKVRRNGNHFYELLRLGKLQPGCKTTDFEGQVVCLLPDGAAWMFTRMELRIKHKPYIQLTAADVSARWQLTVQLQQQEALLRQRGDALRKTIASVHALHRERETQNAKMRAHDVLGQRLSLLLRAVRNRQALDFDLLQGLADGMLEELKAGSGAPAPQDAFESLRQAFRAIGVTIELSGALPQDAAKGHLFVDIIRESVTNAVRHGFATEVSARIHHTNGAYRLEVTNNGYPPRHIKEGGGLGGMRQKVAPHGGALAITIRPSFVLTVDLPGGV